MDLRIGGKYHIRILILISLYLVSEYIFKWYHYANWHAGVLSMIQKLPNVSLMIVYWFNDSVSLKPIFILRLRFC